MYSVVLLMARCVQRNVIGIHIFLVDCGTNFFSAVLLHTNFLASFLRTAVMLLITSQKFVLYMPLIKNSYFQEDVTHTTGRNIYSTRTSPSVYIQQPTYNRFCFLGNLVKVSHIQESMCNIFAPIFY
jgi:hypothetical protein